MKTILMCRVSSKEQEETGYSLDAQEKLLTEYAEKKNLEVAKIFKISESASGKQIRKLFNEVFQYANKNSIQIVCCEKIDRLTRNPKDAVMVQDWLDESEAREVHFLKESFVLNKNTKAHEGLVWDMKVAIARFYTNNLSEEVRKGQKEKIAQGWLPTKPPLGYKTVGDKGHKIHVLDEEKSPFIKKMFELYSTGNYTVKSLVTVMYSEGLRNRSGKEVGKSRMYDLLSDPFYCGYLKWKEEIHKGTQEALISKELFDTVQKKLNRTGNTLQIKKHNPIFKAKMVCGECNGTVTWEIQKGHWYGHCNHYKECGQKTWWRQEKVEEKLFPLFDKVAPRNERILKILEKALKETHADEVDYHAASYNLLTRELETAQKRLEAIYEDKIDQKITNEFYEKKFKEYAQTKEVALEGLRKLNEGNTKYYQAGYAIHELANRASEIYQSPNATVEQKRLLLSKIFSNLELEPDNIKPNYTLAFQFLLEWMPKINSTFEPENGGLDKGKESSFELSHPILLRG